MKEFMLENRIAAPSFPFQLHEVLIDIEALIPTTVSASAKYKVTIFCSAPLGSVALSTPTFQLEVEEWLPINPWTFPPQLLRTSTGVTIVPV